MANKLFITDTILRDAHQSQAATRMRLEDMLPALHDLDQVGYWSLECWGGATFDSCMRFLSEDPWERLRVLKQNMPNTPLQMLLRGQNLLGYKHYADDVVDAFVKAAVKNGINVIRIFDALNDIRNMKAAMTAAKKYGAHVEAAISYTVSPVHNEAYFVELAGRLEEEGADTICIKDMANLLLPYDAYSLVKAMKEKIRVPIHLHTHNTTGTGDMTYLMAVQAGVDIIDTALSPLANGTSQPSTEAMVATLQGTEYDTGLDLLKLSDIAKHFRGVANKLKANGDLTIDTGSYNNFFYYDWTSKVKDRLVYCVVTDKYGNTVKSNTVRMRMAATITTQPKSVKVALNKTAKVTVKAAGDGLKYTWYVKNKGASKYTKSSITKSTYSIKMTSKVNGRYVYCVVKDKYGKTVKSNTVSLRKK